MFKGTLRAKNVVFLTDSHSEIWYLSFINAIWSAVYLLFLRTLKRQHKSCAFERLTKTSYLLIKFIEKPRILA